MGPTHQETLGGTADIRHRRTGVVEKLSFEDGLLGESDLPYQSDSQANESKHEGRDSRGAVPWKLGSSPADGDEEACLGSLLVSSDRIDGNSNNYL